MQRFALIFIAFTSLFSPISALAQSATTEDPERPVFVLVHGTFQWGGQWAPLAALLNEKGYVTYMPSLTGLGEREHLLSRQVGLSTHVEDITNYVSWLDLENVILVGHSYGGAVITGVADRIGDRIAHVVYLDTVPLEHGENILDVSGKAVFEVMGKPVTESGDGWRIPADSLRNPLPTMRDHPWKTYIERIDLTNQPPEFGTIIIGTEDAEVFGYTRTEVAPVRAEKRGWALHVVKGPHILQEVSPAKEEVARMLLNVARDLK